MSKKRKQLPPGWVELTDWETGLPVYVQRSSLRGVRRLPAEVYEPLGDDDAPQELGERTRIDTDGDLLLVRESAEFVLGIE